MKRLNGGELLIDLTELGPINSDGVVIPSDVFEEIKKICPINVMAFQNISKTLIIKLFDNDGYLYRVNFNAISDDGTTLIGSACYDAGGAYSSIFSIDYTGKIYNSVRQI